MRRLVLLLAAVSVLAAGPAAAALVDGGATASSVGGPLLSTRLLARDVPTNRGPLTACSPSGSDCTTSSQLRNFIYITNLNPLPTNPLTLSTRATLHNAFVVSSIDETILVDGIEYGHGTVTPPPSIPDNRFATAGRWPSTVTCGQPATVPCNVVTNPAILPGENTVIFWEGWIHVSGEPNGTYVFRYTVHGTLNGTAVDLNASSAPIEMTG
jgi:hypothetical protein